MSLLAGYEIHNTPCRQAASPADDGIQVFHSAARLLSGIETMHMIKTGQLRCPGGFAFSHADYFYSLAVR